MHPAFVSQADQERHAVPGRLVNGGNCTILIIRERVGWVLYPHGADRIAVELSEADARSLAEGILGCRR